MVGILADQHMGEQPRAGPAAVDGPRGQWCLDEPLAAGAGQSRPDDPVHDEAAGDIFQLFGHVLADPAQPAAAVGADIGCRAELHLHPRNVVRDRTTPRSVLLLYVGQAQPRRHRRRGDLARLQGQLQLLGRLRRGAEAMAHMTGQLVAQLLDQDRLCFHLGEEPRG